MPVTLNCAVPVGATASRSSGVTLKEVRWRVVLLSPQPVTTIPAASSSPHVQFTNAQLDSTILACATLLSLIDACEKLFTLPPSMDQIL